MTTKQPMPNMAAVAAELKRHNAAQPSFEAQIDAATNEAQLNAALRADLESLERVQRAFYEATKDRNSLEQAMRASLAFIEQCVDTWERESAEGK